MSRRSRLALGAQTTRLGAAGMLFAGVANKLFDVELFALASVKLLDTDLDFRAKFAQRFDVIEQFSPELLLRRFGSVAAFDIASSKVLTMTGLYQIPDRAHSYLLARYLLCTTRFAAIVSSNVAVIRMNAPCSGVLATMSCPGCDRCARIRTRCSIA